MSPVWIVVVLALDAALLYLLYKLYKTVKYVRHNVQLLKNVPGVPRHWFFGSVKEINKAGSFSNFRMEMQKRFIDNGEKWYIIWLFHQPVLVVGHPDTAKDVMRSSEPKPEGVPGYGLLDKWIGDSILVSKGMKWERNRHLLTPAFHFDILKPYVEIYNQVAEVFLDKVSNSAREGNSFEVFKPAGLAALDTLMQCALSYKGNIQQLGDSHPYVTAVQTLGNLVIRRSLQIHLWPEFIYKHSTEGREFYKLCDYVHEFSGKIISDRKKALSENPDILKKRHLDFLDILLTARDEQGEGLTDEEISNEVDTFMFAGHDTTSCALSWSIYALGKYPEPQKKLYEEVKDVLNGKSEVDWEDLGKMKYLTCFLREVMRLYTPVPFVSRSLSKTQEIDGVTISKGTHVDLGIYYIHHHPSVWKNPQEFTPERFESEDILNKDPYSFVPFSAGPRNCIGQNFAQNEIKVMIARIVNRFEVFEDKEHNPDPEFDVVLRSRTGIHVNLVER